MYCTCAYSGIYTSKKKKRNYHHHEVKKKKKQRSNKKPIRPRPIQLLDPVELLLPVLIITILIINAVNASGRCLSLPPQPHPLVLLPPHDLQHPRRVAHVDAKDGVPEGAEAVQREGALCGAPALRARDEGGPDEALEVLVGRVDAGELVDELVDDGVVVGGEAVVGCLRLLSSRRGRRVMIGMGVICFRSQFRENSVGVDVDCGFVGRREGDAA